MIRVKEKLKDLRDLYTAARASGKRKIFCVGFNKTGTTSLALAFKELGFIVGDQKRAEQLLTAYQSGDFGPIIEYCKTAQAFQDFPFSYPDTFRHLDKAFPGSLFVLSIRDDAEAWYNSLVNFHARMYGKGSTPTAQDLKSASYGGKGWAWEAFRLVFGNEEKDIYNKEKLMAAYNAHNQSVEDYFRDRPGLLVLNLKSPGAYEDFCKFLDATPRPGGFPWENKTEKLRVRK